MKCRVNIANEEENDISCLQQFKQHLEYSNINVYCLILQHRQKSYFNKFAVCRGKSCCSSKENFQNQARRGHCNCHWATQDGLFQKKKKKVLGNHGKMFSSWKEIENKQEDIALDFLTAKKLAKKKLKRSYSSCVCSVSLFPFSQQHSQPMSVYKPPNFSPPWNQWDGAI